MEIREASVADIPLISKLAHTIWPVAYREMLTKAQLDYMLDKIYAEHQLEVQMKLGHRFLILYVEEYSSMTAAGFASFSRKSKADPVYRLHKLYVLPRMHGKGAGKHLLEFIISVAKKDGARTIELNVNRNNPAQYFYHKLGFKIAREEDIDIGKGYFMNDYVMEKRIDHGE